MISSISSVKIAPGAVVCKESDLRGDITIGEYLCLPVFCFLKVQELEFQGVEVGEFLGHAHVPEKRMRWKAL